MTTQKLQTTALEQHIQERVRQNTNIDDDTLNDFFEDVTVALIPKLSYTNRSFGSYLQETTSVSPNLVLSLHETHLMRHGNRWSEE